MLQRLAEQKVLILAALPELNESKMYLHNDQWKLAKIVIELLAPFEEATKELLRNCPYLSNIAICWDTNTAYVLE